MFCHLFIFHFCSKNINPQASKHTYGCFFAHLTVQSPGWWCGVDLIISSYITFITIKIDDYDDEQYEIKSHLPLLSQHRWWFNQRRTTTQKEQQAPRKVIGDTLSHLITPHHTAHGKCQSISIYPLTLFSPRSFTSAPCMAVFPPCLFLLLPSYNFTSVVFFFVSTFLCARFACVQFLRARQRESFLLQRRWSRCRAVRV